MKNKRIVEEQAPANANQLAPKPSFRRQYIVTIEGEPKFAPVGWGDANHERRHLNSLLALGFIADEVERYYQTTLANRNVSIEPAL